MITDRIKATLKRIYLCKGWKRLDRENFKCVKKKPMDMDMACFSSNIIFSCSLYENAPNNAVFFRPCIRKTSKANYTKIIVALFKSIVCDTESKYHIIDFNFSEQEISDLIVYLEEMQKNNLFFRKLANSIRFINPDKIDIWNGSFQGDKKVLQKVGLLNFPTNKRLFLYFLNCVCLSLKNYKDNTAFLVKKSVNYRVVNCFMATYELAKLLKIDKYVTKCWTQAWQIDGVNEEIHGCVCESYLGQVGTYSTIQITPSLQRALSTLELFDVICNQTDHGPNNYSVYSDGTYSYVQAFDNDNPKTFFPKLNLNIKGSASVSEFITGDTINRPFFDKEIVARLEAVTFRALQKTVGKYLTNIQIQALMYRIRLLTHFIEKNVKSGGVLLLEKEQWTQETVNHELSGKYGSTYLVVYNKRVSC